MAHRYIVKYVVGFKNIIIRLDYPTKQLDSIVLEDSTNEAKREVIFWHDNYKGEIIEQCPIQELVFANHIKK